MFRRHLLAFAAAIVIFQLCATNQSVASLSVLEQALSERAVYDAHKRARIDSLRHQLYLTESPYALYRELYEEYRSYNFDTALIYAEQMTAEAERSGDRELLTDACVSRAFVLLSGGLFHEAYTVLASIEDDGNLPDFYYMTYARLLFDLSDYAAGTNMAPVYNRQSLDLMARLVSRHTPADSAAYWYPLAVIDMRSGELIRSIHRMKQAMLDSHASDHDMAIYTSSIAYIYRLLGDNTTALEYYVQAAVCDIRSSTYETVAMRMIAEILYEQDEIASADRYIHIAMNDAQTYHARHRQVSISQLQPIIEQHYNERIRHRARVTYVLLLVVGVLLVFCVIGIIVLLHHNRTIREAHLTIDAMNHNLSIANRVKEQLLGTLFAEHSQYLKAVERFQGTIKQKVVSRQFSELMSVPKNVDARIQRQLLSRRLDEILIGLFPTFVEQFNSLLRPECAITLKPDELLTPALRIFALIRLGIVHNEVIAEILDYSINTVYTYKTRTLNQSDLSSEEFYSRLMQVI